MLYAENPDMFVKLIDNLVENDVKGVLISGGFNREGYLPIEPFLPVIKNVKKKHDLVICVHIGLAHAKLIEELGAVEVDVIDYEFTLDQQYIRELRGLNRNVEDYVNTMDFMIQNGLNVVPHVPLGFTDNHNAVLETIHYLSKRSVGNIVFVINVDSKKPSLPSFVLDTLRYVRKSCSKEITLGCMRPYWLKKSIDRLVIVENLVDRIANPVGEHRVVFEACCSIPRSLLMRFIRNREHND